ncbi:isoprenylcysteine carboxylmethyltransferase family protein [Acinetobacter pittii]|uniref:methyltransferase family protein n=1 Tax=Acinetobacter pittii TaxID=48296 RepID=UPI001369E211|nr:isoprenylcysteine carboxylmethyltransferase family protein [Acinetobacter pittii]MZY06634.1 isoprenylcysteine carboxylmethyltransferase family protein [Acinetobacter pittii]
MEMNILFTPRVRTVSSRVIGIVLAIILAFSFSKWHFQAAFIEHILWFFGWFFVGIGVMGRIWCSLYISGFKNAKLVTDGPYSLCRNPLYLFSYLGGVGIMLITETFIFPILFTLYFLCYYHFVIRQEEAFLSEKYGTAYSDYIKTIPRFLPSFKNFKEPEFYQVSPTHFRIFLTQVVWFIWVAALVQLFDELRLHGVLPSLFSWF